MLSWILSVMRARRAAAIEAEELVMRHGSRASAVALTLAADVSASDRRRAHHRRVARIAERRFDFLNSLDTASRYDVENRWRARRSAKGSSAD